MKWATSLLLIITLVSACASTASDPAPVSSSPQTTLTVFAAASLTEAFSEIVHSFESSHPGVNVSLNFAGSNTLRAQIEAGAQVDVFASASIDELDTLVANGLVQEDATKIFLTNRLVIITAPENPAGLSRLEDLAQSGLKLVLAAEQVPVGSYARQMLGNVSAEFKNKVLLNVVSNENTVKQVVAKVQLGEADAGIVYASDAVAAPELPVIEIRDEWNVMAEYPMAPLKNTTNSELADKFVRFVLSSEGQAILQKWGFSPVQ